MKHNPKIGDRVKVVSRTFLFTEFHIGLTGKIVGFSENGHPDFQPDYTKIDINDKRTLALFHRKDGLELIEEDEI